MGKWRCARLGLAMTAAMAAAMLSSGIAAAVPPDKFPLPASAFTDTTCGYDIDVTFPGNNEFGIAFYDQAGDQVKFLVAGNFVVTLTNPATGESITANISGPSHLNKHGSWGTGRWALWPDGVLTILSGRSDFDDGSFRGKVHLNVCEALAAP